MASGHGLNGGMWFSPLPSIDPFRAHSVPRGGGCVRLSSGGFWEANFTNYLGPSRCFPFWQEVLGCYVVNSGDGETGKKKCLPALEDYHECLHHRKEVRCDVHVRLRSEGGIYDLAGT